MFSNLQSVSRRWKKDREEWNLANGINFSYTSPYMADNCSIVKTWADAVDAVLNIISITPNIVQQNDTLYMHKIHNLSILMIN